MISISVFIVVAAITDVAFAHSWIHCSDYRGDRGNYEPSKCFGHPRPMNGQVPAMTTFGVDIGYNQQPSTTCHMGASPPLEAYPMARYKQGQEVVLAWPSKNHVAATCTNAFIPDTSLELFIAAEDEDGHPDDFTQIAASFSDDPHVNGVMDFKGFQNCPNFCENMDKSLCTGSFFVPANLPDGVYTFQWKWEFNAGTEPYITCFEAYIGQDVAPVPAPTPMPTNVGQPAPTVAVTQNDCNVGEWGQCGGPGHEGKCCTGGLPCQRQSEWYSQCRTACPSGWECENIQPTAYPTVQAPSPTAPAPSPATPAPTILSPPTGAPTVELTNEPCTLDVTTCSSISIVEGRLINSSGKSLQSASLASACQCAHFCKLFGGFGARFFHYKQSNEKCTCYATATKVQPSPGSQLWSGQIIEDTTNLL